MIILDTFPWLRLSRMPENWRIARPFLPQLLRDLLITLLLVNPLFWITAMWADFERPLINLDYLGVIILACLGWRMIASILLLILVVIDALCVLSTLFVFFRVIDMLDLLRMGGILNMHSHYPWLIGGVLIIIALQFWIVTQPRWQYPKRGYVLCALIGILAFIGGVDRLITSYFAFQARVEWVLFKPNKLVFSQSLFLLRQLTDTHYLHKVKLNQSHEAQLSAWSAPTATAPWFEQPVPNQKNQPKNRLLIIVESWGWAIDPILAQQLYPSLIKLDQYAHIVQSGSVVFKGPTFAGELRELCQAQTLRIRLDDALQHWSCLPRLLQQQGYHTHSFRTSSRSMYQAEQWYPLIGFEQRTFLEDAVTQMGRCYSWPGGCDLTVIPMITDVLAQPGPHFIYWLTTNSHFPYDQRDAADSGYVCRPPVMPDGALCRYAQIHHRFFSALNQLVQQPALRDSEIIVVGDHAPPFLNKSDTALFSDERVPFLHIRTPSNLGR